MGMAETQMNDVKSESRILKNQLIIEHLPFVKYIVNRIASKLPSNVETDDLTNAGTIGLIEAAEHYDPARNTKFATYAAFRVRGAILSELRSRDFLSRSTRQKRRELENVYLKLEQELSREAKDEEVAEEMGIDLDELYKIKKITSVSIISLDEIGCYSNNDKESLKIYLINGDEDDGMSMARVKEIEASIAESIEQLMEKEKLVISLYYWDEMTMKEIGKVLGITESRVSQIHSQAIIRLRGKIIKQQLIDE